MSVLKTLDVLEEEMWDVRFLDREVTTCMKHFIRAELDPVLQTVFQSTEPFQIIYDILKDLPAEEEEEEEEGMIF